MRYSISKFFPTKAIGWVVAQDMWWVVYALIIKPLCGLSCKLRFARISARLKFKMGPVWQLLDTVPDGQLSL